MGIMNFILVEKQRLFHSALLITETCLREVEKLG